MALPPCPFMEADVEQTVLGTPRLLRSGQLSLPRGGISFRLHHAYDPQHNILIICSNPQTVAGAPVPDMLETQSSMSSYRKKLHAVITFLITTFGGYIQVEYQSKGKSPFDEHATIMAAIFVNLCLYAVSSIAEFKLQSEEPYLPIIRTFGPLLGFLVLVLLLIILIPLLGIIASIVWALFIVKASILLFSRIVQCLNQVISGIKRYFERLRTKSLSGGSVNSIVQSEVELNVFLPIIHET